MSRFLVLDVYGSPLANTECVVVALRIMNTLDGAASVIREDGEVIGTRHYLNASSVSEWLEKLGRWS